MSELTDLNRLAAPSPFVELEQAHALCRKVAHQHGANFSVGFRFLPLVKRRAVYASYAFCRIADDIVDEPGEDVAERLDQWQLELERTYDGRPQHPVTLALHDASANFPIPKDAFLALIEGCRWDLSKHRYETFADLRKYCDLVATSISDISLAIFGYRTSRALTHGRALATALQLTNIVRDIGDDLSRDRIYLPLEDLKRFNVTEEMLSRKLDPDRITALVEFQATRAESFFRDAQPLIGELSFDARFPTVLMGSVYASILKKIRMNPMAVLDHRTSLSVPHKIAIVGRSLLWPRFL